MKQNLNPAIGFGGLKSLLDRGVYYMQEHSPRFGRDSGMTAGKRVSLREKGLRGLPVRVRAM